MKPLIPYQGGKRREIKAIEKFLPENLSDLKYCEPFFGGGSLFFHLEPKKAVINDIDLNLMRLYYYVGRHSSNKNLVRLVDSWGIGKEAYYHVRDEVECKTLREYASRTYYLRSLCFRSIAQYSSVGKFNTAFDSSKSVNLQRLEDTSYNELLGRCKMYSRNYEDIFEKCNDKKFFIFCDPPYPTTKSNGYFGGNWNVDDYDDLYDLMRSSDAKVMVILPDSGDLRQVFSRYVVEDYDFEYKPSIKGVRHFIAVNY